MSEAERILLEIEAEALEFKAARIRARLGGSPAAPISAKRAAAPKSCRLPVPPTDEELLGATPLLERRVERGAMKKGIVKP